METYQVTFNPSDFAPKQITKTYKGTLENAKRLGGIYASFIKSTIAKIVQL